MGQISTEIIQKANMQKIIDKEHGKEYHKNVNLSGYTVYRGDSFITFRFVTLGKNARVCVYIDYIYVTSTVNEEGHLFVESSCSEKEKERYVRY